MNKSEILQIIRDKLSEKITALERMIAETRASNNETKSSMGDKYETTREMVQQEINNLQVQLNENINARNSLKMINTNYHQKIGLGSLVETDKGFFYVAVSMGGITIEQQRIFAVSPESPLGKMLMGLRQGDHFLINGLDQKIVNVS